MRLTLNQKLSVGIFIIVSGTLILVMTSGNLSIRQAIEGKIADDLLRAKGVFQRFQEERFRELLIENRIIAQIPYLKSVVTTPGIDYATVLDSSREIQKMIQSDLFMITDSRGTLLASVSEPQRHGVDLSTEPAFADALQGENFLGVWSNAEGVYHVIASPFLFGFEVVGAMLVGYRIDRKEIDTLAQTTKCEVVLISGRNAIISSGASARLDSASTIRGINQFYENNPEKVFSQILDKEQYLMLKVPLGDPGSRDFYILARSLDQELFFYRELQRGLFLLGLVILGVALIFTMFYSKGITRPIEDLTAGAQRVASGDLTFHVAASSGDEIGTLARSFNQMTDSLRQSRKILHESEKRISSIVSAAVDGIITINEKGIMELFNPASERIFGYTAKEAIGQNVSMLMPSPYREEHDGYLSRYLETGEVRIIGVGREVEGRHKDGRIFPLDIAVSELQLGERKLFIGIVRDITERKEAEEEIRKLSYAVEQSPNTIMITDMRGVVEYVNSTFRVLTGYERQEVIGRTARVLKEKILPDDEYKQLWHLIRRGEAWMGEFLDQRKDGVNYWQQVIVSPMHDLKKNVTHFLIIMQDITKRKEAEEQMKKALALKNEFTSTVSHELRTPLAISKEALSLVVREKVGALNEKQKEIVKMASSNIDRLGVLINDLLDISKIESGKFELNKEYVDICSIVRESCESWRLKAGHLHYHLPDKSITLHVDKGRFLQILSNLISNAVKFTPPDGSVDISIEETVDKVEFSVKDTGPGIAKEDIPKLFQKFQQLKRTYKPGLQGTGLGLSIVKQLVELHGGSIQVKTEEGKGADFIFSIPKSEEEET